MDLYTRDITQAYTQSKTLLNREIYVRPRNGWAEKGTLWKVILPLYGLAETGTHWFQTYHQHHENRLGMVNSTFDMCLLHTNETDSVFAVVGLQTDDTLILGNKDFITKEEKEMLKAKLIAKQIETLTSDNPLTFNGISVKIQQNFTISSLKVTFSRSFKILKQALVRMNS